MLNDRSILHQYFFKNCKLLITHSVFLVTVAALTILHLEFSEH